MFQNLSMKDLHRKHVYLDGLYPRDINFEKYYGCGGGGRWMTEEKDKSDIDRLKTL